MSRFEIALLLLVNMVGVGLTFSYLVESIKEGRMIITFLNSSMLFLFVSFMIKTVMLIPLDM